MTAEFLTDFLKEWNLFDAFMENKIQMSVDGALYPHAQSIYTDNNLEPRVNVCMPHNFGNTADRALNANLGQYWPDGPRKIKVNS